MRLDANGLDLDDPDVQALYAQQKRDQQAQTHVAPIPPPAESPAASQIQQQLTPSTAPPPLANPPPAPLPAPAQAAEPAPAAPGMVKNESKTTLTREIPTKAEAGLNKQIAGEFTQQAGLARQEGDINRRQAEAAATGAEGEADVSSQRQQAYDASLAQHNPAIQAAQAQVASDKAKYDAWVTEMAQRPTVGFYEGEEGKGRMVAHSLAIALGEIGRILLHPRGGGVNSALEIIKNTEDTYYKDQRTKIEKQNSVGNALKERIGVSQGIANETQKSKLDDLNDLNLHFAARSQALADRAKAEGMRYGTEHAQVTADQMAGALEQRRDMYLGQYEQGIRTKATTETQSVSGTAASGGKASADQAKAAGFAERMQHQLATLKGLPPLSNEDRDTILRDMTNEELAAKHPEVKAFAQRTGLYKNLEEKLSPQGRAYYQAAREFISANLRRESGAAISQGEVHDALQRFLPVRGDTEADRARKNAAMEDVVHGAVREAGPAASTIAQPQAARPAPGDAALAAQAKATKPGDPLYDSAQRWLRAHGM